MDRRREIQTEIYDHLFNNPEFTRWVIRMLAEIMARTIIAVRSADIKKDEVEE